MKSPITPTPPTIQDMLSLISRRRDQGQLGEPDAFRNTLGIHAGQQENAARHVAPPQGGTIDNALLRAKAADAGIEEIIQRASQTYNLDADVIASVIQAQSNFNPKAKSPAGAQGLMQLMPATAAELGVKDAFDPEQNIMGASRYLRSLIDRYDGELTLALKAYTWGMGNVDRNPNPAPAEVERFIAAISASSTETATARRSTDAILAEIAASNQVTQAYAAHPEAIELKARQSGVDGIIRQAAQAYDLSPNLIAAVIHAESDFDKNAISHAGAQGLMQLMPATAAELGVKDPFDPEQNIMGASRYLKGLVERYDGDLRLALAAYNWGMGNLERNPGRLPAETTDYIAKIMALLPDEMDHKAATMASAAVNPEPGSRDGGMRESRLSGRLQPNLAQAAQAYAQNPNLVETAIWTERNGHADMPFDESMLSGAGSAAGV